MAIRASTSGEVMYEPPNRGGKTWTARPREVAAGTIPHDHGCDDPHELLPDAPGLSLVWSGWEPLVPGQSDTNLLASVAIPIAKPGGTTTITGPTMNT